MNKERTCIVVPRKLGEKTHSLLSEAGLLDTEYRIQSDTEMLYIPVRTKDHLKLLHALKDTVEIQLCERVFEKKHETPQTLQEALSNIMAPEELALLPRAYDMIGDIAVLEIPEEISEHSREIGNAFQEAHKNFKTVLRKKGAISGAKRIREYEHLAGEKTTETIHTEYGCRIAVDLARAYFSPRLLEEHNRIANLVNKGETIVDMFTGVGPFALLIASRVDAHVYALDLNPAAIDLLKQSISMNKLVGTITPIIADASEYMSQHFSRNVDRIIMNHPSRAFEFLKQACTAIRRGGVIHYYDFLAGNDLVARIKEKAIRHVEEAGRSVSRFGTIRKVRDSAPYEYQMVADIFIE